MINLYECFMYKKISSQTIQLPIIFQIQQDKKWISKTAECLDPSEEKIFEVNRQIEWYRAYILYCKETEAMYQ